MRRATGAFIVRGLFISTMAAWTVGFAALVAMTMSLTIYRNVEARETFTATEMALVDQTASFAKTLGVEVRGVITERFNPLTDPNAIAWYVDGTAYYYRPRVAKWVSLVPAPGKNTVSSVAAHETCHALSLNHDIVHWNCSAFLATPSYPRPE